jgi:hypothetical protein
MRNGYARDGRWNRDRRAAGESRGGVRLEIDRRLLSALADGPRTYAEVKARVPGPPAQVWARMERLIASGAVRWVHGGKRLARTD